MHSVAFTAWGRWRHPKSSPQPWKNKGGCTSFLFVVSLCLTQLFTISSIWPPFTAVLFPLTLCYKLGTTLAWVLGPLIYPPHSIALKASCGIDDICRSLLVVRSCSLKWW